jgi:nucleoid-associated protein YgaU
MSVEPATLMNTITGERIAVLFNPEEYTVNRDLTYAQLAVPGLSAPVVQFVHGNAQTIDLQLFVDSYEASKQAAAASDVRALTNKVVSLMDIAPSLHAPPPVIFAWGSLTFTCVITKCAQHFIMFRADGIPLRARLELTLSEFRNIELEAREVKRETADHTKTHLVAEGETLASIAFASYGDATRWRPIALANAVDDPELLTVGANLAIPRLPFRDPETGTVFP